MITDKKTLLYAREQYEKRKFEKKIYSSIAKELKEVFGKEYSVSNVYSTLNSNPLKDIEDKKNYEVQGENVVFFFNKTDPSTGEQYKAQMSVDFKTLRDIWHDYTEYGNNLSGKKVMRKHDINRTAFSLLKSRLGLTKDEHSLPPIVLDYIQQNMGEEALEKEIEEETARAIRDKYNSRYVSSYEKNYKKYAEKAIKYYVNHELRLEDFTKAIQEYHRVIQPFKIERFGGTGNLAVCFGDIHFGKRGTDEIVKRFRSLYEYIIEQNEKNIYLFCNGDIIENLAPNGMHSGMINSMEMHGFDLVMFSVGVLERLIVDLSKKGRKVIFYGIGGNHDRIGENNEEDSDRTAALIIYEMMKRGLSGTNATVNYFKSTIGSFQMGSLNFVCAHGEYKFDKRKSEDILWKHGRADKYNVIVHGHMHSAIIGETKNATKIQCPALAGRGDYDAKLDLYSEPGFVVVRENKAKTADVLFKRV